MSLRIDLSLGSLPGARYFPLSRIISLRQALLPSPCPHLPAGKSARWWNSRLSGTSGGDVTNYNCISTYLHNGCAQSPVPLAGAKPKEMRTRYVGKRDQRNEGLRYVSDCGWRLQLATNMARADRNVIIIQSTRSPPII